MENEPLWIADVAADISETTYAVGLGTTATTSAAAPETISGNHGGWERRYASEPFWRDRATAGSSVQARGGFPPSTFSVAVTIHTLSSIPPYRLERNVCG